MRTIKKLICKYCNEEFVPRTFHEIIPLYPYPGKYQVLRYDSYFKREKPFEVIIQQWVTYCPSCRSIIKFAKQIGKLVKNYRDQNPDNVELKYVPEDFEKPCSIYPEYLEDIITELQKRIEIYFNEININSWLYLYSREDQQGDHFKFLVRFIAKIESYHESQFGIQKDKDMPIKVKELKLPKDLEEDLINLNTVRNNIVHHGYELTENDHKMILENYSNFIKYLLNRFIKPEITKIITESGYDFLDLKDVNQEVIFYLKKIFYEKYSFNMNLFNTMIRPLNSMFME